MYTILLTGATGFLGSKILGMLSEQQHQILVLKRKNSNTSRIKNYIGYKEVKVYDVEELDTVFLKNKIDVILHLATCYGRNNESNEEIIEANFHFPKKIIDLSIIYKVPFFINTHTVLNSTANFYANSKHKLYGYLKNHSDQFKKTINILPEYFYGEGDDHWKLIPMLIAKIGQNISQIDLTSGLQKRNFIHISDMVEAYKIVLENIENSPSKSTNIYIGTNEFISIKDLALFCKEQFPESKTVLNFGALPDRKDDIDLYDNQQIYNWGWMPRVTLKEGILSLINHSKK